LGIAFGALGAVAVLAFVAFSVRRRSAPRYLPAATAAAELRVQGALFAVLFLGAECADMHCYLETNLLIHHASESSPDPDLDCTISRVCTCKRWKNKTLRVKLELHALDTTARESRLAVLRLGLSLLCLGGLALFRGRSFLRLGLGLRTLSC
jgi:hypothetical protein